MPFGFGFGGEVVYPTASSVFVAVGDNSDAKRGREVWDLAKKKRVGMVRGDVRIDKPFALSPDGVLFAAKTTVQSGFVVFDTKSNRMVAMCKDDRTVRRLCGLRRTRMADHRLERKAVFPGLEHQDPAGVPTITPPNAPTRSQ